MSKTGGDMDFKFKGENMDFLFTEHEIKSVLSDPRVIDLIIDYHHNTIAQADAMGFGYTYHEKRISTLEKLKAKQDL